MSKKRKVYVLQVGAYSDRRLVGVYSSLEAAKAAIPDRGQPREWRYHKWLSRPTWYTQGFGLKEGDGGYFDEDADVSEWVIDAPVDDDEWD